MDRRQRSFTLKMKLIMIQDFKRQLCYGQSLHDIATAYTLDQTTIKRWLKDEKKYISVWDKRKLSLQSTAKGKQSILKVIKEPLLQFIFKLWEQGQAVTVLMVMDEACRLLPTLQAKSREAQ